MVFVWKASDEMDARISMWADAVIAKRSWGGNRESRALEVPSVMGPWQWWCGKAGEVALADFLSLDPRAVVSWDLVPDSGHDLTLNGITVDVKTAAHSHARALIWPVSKLRSMTASNMAELLVFARGVAPRTIQLMSFIPSVQFRDHRRISEALPGEPRIKGTPYMHVDAPQFRDIDRIVDWVEKRRAL